LHKNSICTNTSLSAITELCCKLHREEFIITNWSKQKARGNHKFTTCTSTFNFSNQPKFNFYHFIRDSSIPCWIAQPHIYTFIPLYGNSKHLTNKTANHQSCDFSGEKIYKLVRKEKKKKQKATQTLFNNNFIISARQIRISSKEIFIYLNFSSLQLYREKSKWRWYIRKTNIGSKRTQNKVE
jgi:hypothetical protein